MRPTLCEYYAHCERSAAITQIVLSLYCRDLIYQAQKKMENSQLLQLIVVETIILL